MARDSGVDARCDLEGDVGVWSPQGKIASLGLRLRDDVAQHGVALNVAVDPRLGQGVVLCGKSWIELANLEPDAPPAGNAVAIWSRALARQWQLQLGDDGGWEFP